ncbi:MAG TPA: hypothetical protein VGC42_13380 [Kofleriaceae bacterium]
MRHLVIAASLCWTAAASAAPDPAPRFAPQPLAGPYAVPGDYCNAEHVPIDRCEVTTDLDADHVAAPFQAVAKILIITDDQMHFPRASLALQVGGQWYVLPDIGEAGAGHGGGHSLAFRMAGARLVVDWTSSIGRFGHDDETAIIVCGVGAADHRPRCTGPIVTSQLTVTDHCAKDPDCTRRPTATSSFRCVATLRGDVLDITDDRKPLRNPDAEQTLPPRLGACATHGLAGAHKLAF